MSEKIRTYVTFDEQEFQTWVITGDVDATLEFVRSYIVEMEDGDEVMFRFKRQDMTQEEINAAPEV